MKIFKATEAEEAVKGAEFYRDTLRRLHACLLPDVYLEIGVRHGVSLSLSQAATTVGVDPQPEITASLADHVCIVEKTSDEFFATDALRVLPGRIDLAFIDGMHLFEFALRDFINTERLASPYGAIVLDDIFPNHSTQAARERRSGVWTGDVWRILPCLRQYRPKLRLYPLDTLFTGLLVVTGLDPNDTALRDNYDAIVAEFTSDDPPPGAATINRTGALHPADAGMMNDLNTLRQATHVNRSA